MQFTAFERAKQGTGASRRLRNTGRTPAIVFGGTTAPAVVELDHNSLWFALKKESFHSALLDMELNGNTATATREIEGGEETLEVSTPLVISCQKGMAEARIPNMRGIMAARTKPLNVVAPAALEALTTYSSYSMPAAKSSVKLIDPNNLDELVALLHNEAKVI